MSEAGTPKPPPAGSERTFQGWQRAACLVGVGLLLLLAVFLVVNVVLGLLGVH